MSKNLIVPENEEILNDLKVGQIFSTFDAPFQMLDNNNQYSQSAYVVYLGSNPYIVGSLVFLVVLKNGNTLIWSNPKSQIENYLNKGWFKKTNRKLIPNALLQEIRLSRDKQNVEIVAEETRIQLPSEIKNKLLTMLGQPENKEYFPLQSQNAGRKKRTRRKTKRTIRKTKKNKKTRKHLYKFKK